MDRHNKIRLISKRIDKLYERLKSCDICPRNCKVNRLKGEIGFCEMAKDLSVYTAFLHQGEEPGISEGGGSGTIFFSGCNLKCAYCQNYKFSHLNEGKVVGEDDLAQIMLKLQGKGASNISLVTPTHYLPQILKSLSISLKKGLSIPIIYNTSGFEKRAIIAQIRGIVDVYLADIRYMTPSIAKEYSNAPDYFRFCQESIIEMYKQCRHPIWNRSTLERGLIIRHLVLPGHIEESKAILSWIKKNTPTAYTSVMFQYKPYFKAGNYPQINREINISEYNQIKDFTEELDLEGWVQEFNPPEKLAGVNFSPSLEI